MGTRADFYVGTGKDSEWIGSIAFDGYPEGVEDDAPGIFNCRSEGEWRSKVMELISNRDDGTFPKDGWPWPWDDSGTTDCVYTFHKDKVWAEYDKKWLPALAVMSLEEDELGKLHGEPALFPDMKSISKVTFGRRSGLIVIGIKD